MLKLKLNKLKQICASVLLPRLILKNLKYPNELNYNRTLEQLSRARKSTNSGNNDGPNEKQKQIIEKCFSENNYSDIEIKVPERVNKIQHENIILPEFYKVTKQNKSNTLISKLFNNKGDDAAKKNALLHSRVQATTSKVEEEKLTQKIEIVDETPHVEAHAPKVEGFNATPKVLGHESCTFEMSKQNNPPTDIREQIDLDELAKRCIGLPDDEIDKIIIQELKNASRNSLQSKSDIDYNKNTNITSLNDFILLYEVNACKECKLDKIQPSHLDSVPFISLDTSSTVTNDYKVSGLIREYPTIVLTADIDDQQPDVPALSPYEKSAIPFYEYINKENITPDDDSKIETAAMTESVEETEIIINDETLQRESINQGHPTIEGENLHPKPNINQFAEISGQRMTKGEKIGNLNKRLTHDTILNVFNSQRVFMSNPEPPSDWHSYQNIPQQTPHKEDTPNSSISSAFLPGGNRRSLEIPLNTAISANQNPDEYYNMSFPEEYVADDQTAPVQRIFAECPVTQNLVFSALPQIELEEVSKATIIPDSFSSHKNSISEMVLEPEVKQNDCVTRNLATEANLEEPVEKKDSLSYSESAIPLSLLLKRIREQNRLEYCRNIFAKADIQLEGTKKFACPPPVDKSKAKTSVKPCQPKPKSEPCKPCPSPCPEKKDPCAKFLPIFFSSIFRYNLPVDGDQTSKEAVYLKSTTLITEDIIKQIEKLGEMLRFLSNNKAKNFEDVTICARDFEPWIPIPSWPIPKKEKARPFVCPKEGCKVPVARADKKNKEKQCEGITKRSYALSEVFSS